MDSPEPQDVTGEEKFALLWEASGDRDTSSLPQASKVPWWRMQRSGGESDGFN